MQTKRLGRSAIEVPPIIFGGNVFGWTADRAMSFRLLDALVDAGLTCIDTADVYSAWVPGHQGGESESVIGEWLRARPGMRARVTLMTKVGMEIPGRGTGLSAAWIARAAEDSLKRLGTDVIDLYYAHKDDETVPQEETARAFAGLVAAGKVRVLGASNFSAARLESALATSNALGVPRYEVMQPHYNLMERGIEAELIPACVKHGLAVAPYFALAAGFLTGKYRSEADLGKSPRGARGAGKYLTPKGHAVLAALDAVAARTGATPGQVAIAWLVAKPGITAALASATSPEQLRELVGAASLSLDAEAMATLDSASA
jgi:aryl-alcohol dehydrogenase-like predicted oxidoreductase